MAGVRIVLHHDHHIPQCVHLWTATHNEATRFFRISTDTMLIAITYMINVIYQKHKMALDMSTSRCVCDLVAVHHAKKNYYEQGIMLINDQLVHQF